MGGRKRDVRRVRRHDVGAAAKAAGQGEPNNNESNPYLDIIDFELSDT